GEMARPHSAAAGPGPTIVPVAVAPRVTRRTRYAWPWPSAAITRSPGRRRRTRTRCRLSAASKVTRSSEIRSGAIVNRRTALQGGPAVEGDGVHGGQAARAHARADLVGLGVE